MIRQLGPMVQAMTNLFQPQSTTIVGVRTQDWMGPGQPVKPVAPDGTQPRGLQYFQSHNLTYTPRAYEEYSADDLQQASMYPLARVLIENVKDAISRWPIEIGLRRLPGETGKEFASRKPDRSIITAISDIVENPNPDMNRQEFTRRLCEDMLVIDAASALMRTTPKGNLIEIRPITGASITRYIDTQGFTPQPPSPAYAQVWYNLPFVDLTTKQLLYAARNILPTDIYGTSPVQQGMRWIQIGSARLDFKMNAYSDGNIPDAIQVVPMGVPVGNITEAQNWMVSDLAGNLKKRRQMRLIQGFTEDGKDQILFPKESLLSDPYDEFEINEFCFLFGVSRQRLSKMLQRSAAQSDQEAADKEGLEPFLDWMRNSVWNRIIQKYLGFTDYEAKFSEDQQLDALKQAQVEDVRLKNATMTINEAREARGEDPRPESEANEPMIYTASGLVPINVDKEIERSKKKLDAMPPPVAGPGFGGGFGADSGDANTQAKIAKLESQHATIEEALRSLNDIARQMLGDDALLNKGLGPSLVVPSVAERIMLQNILNKELPQNLVLKLYQNDRVPRPGDVAANYQEANFIGYSAAVLSGDQWKLDNGMPVGAVGETQVFASKADQPGQAIFGYYVVQADSGLLMWAERFVPHSVFGDVPVVIAQNRASIAVTPVLTLSKGKSN